MGTVHQLSDHRPLGVEATLLLERALVLDDVALVGHDVAEARTLLALEAADAPARARGFAPPPARLLARVDERRIAEILSEPSLPALLEEAAAWECAALASGRSIGEWALLVLLAAS